MAPDKNEFSSAWLLLGTLLPTFFVERKALSSSIECLAMGLYSSSMHMNTSDEGMREIKSGPQNLDLAIVTGKCLLKVLGQYHFFLRIKLFSCFVEGYT